MPAHPAAAAHQTIHQPSLGGSLLMQTMLMGLLALLLALGGCANLPQGAPRTASTALADRKSVV